MFLVRVARSAGAALLGAGLTLVPATARAGGDGVDWTPVAAQSTADEASWQPAAPVEHMKPFYDLDWSLGLRGSYIRDSASGDRYKTEALPSVTLTHTGDMLSYHATAGADVSKTGNGAVNIDQARLSAGTALQFDPKTSLTSNASLSMTQEDPNAPDVASGVVGTPVQYSGTADSTWSQSIGRINVAITGNAGRNVYGPTTLTGGVIQDNASQNNTFAGTGLRLGFQLTPVLEPFVSGNVTRTVYDQVSPGLGVKLDSNLYTLMAGVSARWGDRLAGSVSAGIGHERFDAGTLPDIDATLYDASLSYKPTDVLTLDAAFTTTMGAPGPSGSGTAKIDYAATANATYLVNDLLTWRGSAGWHNATYAGSGGTDTGYTFGVGADYLLSRHAKLSADYGFEHAEVTPNPAADIHTVSLGVTLQK